MCYQKINHESFMDSGVRRKRRTMNVPVIDLGRCSECMGCVEIAPDILQYNEFLGYMVVIEMDEYEVEEVDEAIKNCPEDCIYWDEV